MCLEGEGMHHFIDCLGRGMLFATVALTGATIVIGGCVLFVSVLEKRLTRIFGNYSDIAALTICMFLLATFIGTCLCMIGAK